MESNKFYLLLECSGPAAVVDVLEAFFADFGSLKEHAETFEQINDVGSYLAWAVENVTAFAVGYKLKNTKKLLNKKFL